MQIQLVINDSDDENSVDVALDTSSTLSSWLIDYYFTNLYLNQVKISSKSSVQPHNIVGLHDMFIIYQIIETTSSSTEFFDLCKKKFQQIEADRVLNSYNNYLTRCGLKDIIDIFLQCNLKSLLKVIKFRINNVQDEIDRLILNYLLSTASKRFLYDAQMQISTEATSEAVLRLFHNEKEKHIEQTITKNYIKHTMCTYLSLLLDTRNEHALIHCLATPARAGIERRTIVELRRVSQMSKNEFLTMYQILLSFLRRKELILSRISSSQQDSTSNDDESFVILEKHYTGIKEFFDFIEQIQIIIEENEHLKIESIVTFRKIMMLLSKQLRKDSSFNRCDAIFKEMIEEFCQCFRTTLPLMDCTSPIRSASSGGTLAGRRFLRSVAYLCAKQTIQMPIMLSNNDHYDSPSTGLKKATSFRLLRSPLTPIPILLDPVLEKPTEEKSVEIPVESVFSWQKSVKPKENDENLVSKTPMKEKRFQRRKSQRCLDLSTVDENCDLESETNQSTDLNQKTTSESTSSGSVRHALEEIDVSSCNSEERQQVECEASGASQSSVSLSLASGKDKENLSTTTKKRTAAPPKPDQPLKKQKRVNNKPLVAGQKMITNFFQSKS